MSEKRYLVKFTGRLARGMDVRTVKSNLILDVGLSDEKAELMLTRARVVLKRFNALAEAQDLAERFERAGALCIVEDRAPGAGLPEAGEGESSFITFVNRFIPASRRRASGSQVKR